MSSNRIVAPCWAARAAPAVLWCWLDSASSAKRLLSAGKLDDPFGENTVLLSYRTVCVSADTAGCKERTEQHDHPRERGQPQRYGYG